ncbi:MAG: acyltransferase family protein [Caulobacteraceae bacterium]
MNQPVSHRLASIQVLRAAAALSVALFHAAQWSHLDFSVGAAGVDVFFVISGFVLWTACEARPPTPGAFLLARAGRILPLYWIVTLTVAGAALAAPMALPIVLPQGRHLVLSLLLLPHADPAGGPFPLLPTGWTLTYEAFFYLVMALALAAPRDRRLQIVSALLLAASLLGFAYHGWYTLLANPLLLEFLAGVGLARLWIKGRFERLPRALGPGLIAAGLLALAAWQASGLRDDFLRPFVWAPPAALIVAGALKLEADRRVGAGWLVRALTAEGDASYSLYLVQAPVIAAFAWLTPAWPAALRAPASFGLAIGVGWACYALVEKPLFSAVRALHHLPAAHRRDGRGLGTAEQEALAAVDPDLA